MIYANRFFRFSLLAAAIFFLALPSLAQRRQQPPAEQAKDEKPKDEKEKDKDKEKEKKTPEEKSVSTKHSIRIGGQEIKYTATTGTMLLKLEDGTAKASVFYIAYTRDDVSDLSQRPITFTFNGGPGSSSVWLHLGAFGPRRVDMGDAGALLPPPYKLVDNEFSLLDVTDLVFIDPVSTGYSRAVPGEAPKQFHGIQEDVQSVGDFIRLYATRNKRWSSPKFLAGESYGTTRAAGLSGYLQSRHGMYLNGIVLISSILNFETAEFDPGNDLPYVLYLPSYTAIAWYHKRLPADLQGDLQKALAESKQFALHDYLDALMAGDRLTGARRAETTRMLARLTGLSPEFIEEKNERVRIMDFTHELLRAQRQVVGRLDGRFSGPALQNTDSYAATDPSYAAILGPYAGVFNDYVRGDLKFESDLPYEILTGRVQPWSFAPYENRYVNVAETLRTAMVLNPNLHVFVAKGYFDLATPFFAADYTFDHLDLPANLRANLSGDYFEAGHMVYVHMPSLQRLKHDIAQFIHASVKQ